MKQWEEGDTENRANWWKQNEAARSRKKRNMIES
jgi:hypothetical protein